MRPRRIPEPAPGAVVGGRYQLERLLGTGGFGRVYQAVQMPLGRRVAVKLLVSHHQSTSARFAREAALAQRLEHPNTVRILDFGATPEGSPFIVFELIRGMSVAELLARHGPMPLAVALEITSQVLKSLMEAHALGIVHRDIKPPNVMVTSHPGEPYFVKVLDFGVAKDLSAPATRPRAGTIPLAAGAGASPALTSAGEMVGTPRYMAPEQARGEDTGPETDVYAVGLLLAEMLLGHPVYPQENALAVAAAQASESPVPLGPLETSPAMAVLGRATQKARAQRFPSAAAMLAAVEQLQGKSEAPSGTILVADDRVALGFATAPTQATPAMATSSGTIAVKRRTLWLTAAAAVGALVGLGALGFVVLGDTKKKPRRAPQVEDDEEEEPRHRGLPEPPTIDWKTRKVPTSAEALEARLGRTDYEHQPAETISSPGFSQWTWRLFGPDCAGVVLLQLWGTEALAVQAEDAQRQAKLGVTLRTEGRILYVILASTGTRDDPRCSVPLADRLTR